MSKLRVELGSQVTLHFSLRLASEDRVVDGTRDRKPLTIEMGTGDLIDGLEKRLIGLRAGDKRRFEIPCEQAYGPIEDACLQSLPRKQFPPGMTLREGQVIGFAGPDDRELPGTVVKMAHERVMVDFTHPLTGHDLVFEVEILDVQPKR
ncbi:MAG: peptidylprolyl isomerase [Acidiferrobacterales bacterium]